MVSQSTLVNDVTKSLGLIKEGQEAEIKMKEMTIRELEEKSKKREDAALLMFKEWKAVFSFVAGILYSVPLTSDVHEEIKKMPESVSKNSILEAIDRRQQIYFDALRKILETESKYKSLLNK